MLVKSWRNAGETLKRWRNDCVTIARRATLDDTSSSPPCALASCFAIVRPSPAPAGYLTSGQTLVKCRRGGCVAPRSRGPAPPLQSIRPAVKCWSNACKGAGLSAGAARGGVDWRSPGTEASKGAVKGDAVPPPPLPLSVPRFPPRTPPGWGVRPPHSTSI
jgi:hypothetical protein